MSTLADPALLDALGAHGLPGSLHELPDRPLPDAQWARLLRRARDTRLVGLLAAAVDDGAFPVTDPQFDELVEAHLAAMCTSVRLEAELGEIVRSLDAAGVDVRLLKGSAVAHSAYLDPCHRPFGDLDLLVRGSQFDRATAVLAELGYCRAHPELRASFDRRFGKAVTLIHADTESVVDLHRTFVMGPLGLTVDADSLFDEPAWLRVAGRDVATLGWTDRFVHACYNAGVGEVPPRALALRDVAQLALAGPGVEFGDVVDRVAPWQGQAVVARAVSLTWERLALADRIALSQWAIRYEPDRVERRRLDCYLARRSYTAKAMASLPVIPGLGAKAAYAAAVALPRRQWRASHGEGALAWWARGLRAVPVPGVRQAR